MVAKRFERRIEDFTCMHCGAVIKGGGYTDHCPRCLFSMHVDVHPGDRACDCHGMMEPVSVEQTSGSFKINYRCARCRHTHRVNAHENDGVDALIAVAKAYAARS